MLRSFFWLHDIKLKKKIEVTRLNLQELEVGLSNVLYVQVLIETNQTKQVTISVRPAQDILVRRRFTDKFLRSVINLKILNIIIIILFPTPTPPTLHDGWAKINDYSNE